MTIMCVEKLMVFVPTWACDSYISHMSHGSSDITMKIRFQQKLKNFLKCGKSRFPIKNTKNKSFGFGKSKISKLKYPPSNLKFRKYAFYGKSFTRIGHVTIGEKLDRRVTLFRDKMESEKGFLRDEFSWRWTKSNKQEYSNAF